MTGNGRDCPSRRGERGGAARHDIMSLFERLLARKPEPVVVYHSPI